MFIKKIFDKKIDYSVKKHFFRFGKGEYRKRAVLNVRKNNKIKVTTTYEFSNDFVVFLCNISTNIRAEGLIITKNALERFEGKKKKGMWNYDVNKEFSSQELKKIVEESYFSLLDCSGQGFLLKVKKRLPKPGKGGDAKVNDKFCVLELDNKYWPQLKKEFFFDLGEFKKARIEHTYIIKDISFPKDLVKEKDFEKIRKEAKKIGKIIREIEKDKEKLIKESGFEI